MSVPRLPDFIIIGAMKCGTSTLHEQLDRRTGLFLSRPKEPNFFSDDAQYARGLDWYASLFAEAGAGQLCGESSTHYTKLPTHPLTVERMRRHLPDVKVVYVMRDPIERILSQYVHEWTERAVRGPVDRAVRENERYVAYSSYARQLEPYLESYGPEAVLPVSFERMCAAPEEVLERVCRFLGDPSPEPATWHPELGVQNVSSERLLRSRLRDGLVRSGLGRTARRLLPALARRALKAPWRMRRRPGLAPETVERLREAIDPDLARLSRWLGRELDCRGWREEAARGDFGWSAPPRSAA